MTDTAARPLAGTAEVHVLFNGYVDTARSPWSVASTVTYVSDGDVQVIVDPGFVPGTDAILGPLRDRGIQPQDITDVVFSHHHPDHTVNAALFPEARIHDHWAIYRHDTWQPRPAEVFQLLQRRPPDRDTRPHTAGHHHAGRNRRGNGGAHPSMVDPPRPSRGPVRLRHSSDPQGPSASAGHRRLDHPRPRRTLPTELDNTAITPRRLPARTPTGPGRAVMKAS